MNKVNKKQIVDQLIKQAKDCDGGKLKSNDVLMKLEFSPLHEDEKKDVIHMLEDKGLLVTPKGFSSFSPLQKAIHRFINDDLLHQLVSKRKASLEVTEEMLNDVDTSEEDKFYVLNKKGDLIRQACNNTNITEARRVAHAKKLMEDAQPSI